MSIVTMSEKGQVTIPQEIRKSLNISKGDALVVEMDAQGAIIMRPAAVLPIENYSAERLKEFAVADAMTASERRRLQKALNA